MYNFYPKNVVQPRTRGCMHKILLVMKLTTLILITAILHVSASSLAQKVTLTEKNAPLAEVFNRISTQTGYDFLFTGSDLKNAKPVTINARNEELSEVLKKIFEGQPLDFTIEDKSVVIKGRETSFIDKLKTQIKAELAQVTITGTVTDETGQPLTGATVKIKNTGQATTTDSKGAYTITVPDANTILVFSYIGYEPQEFRAKDITNGSVIKMKAAQNNLQEVVVSKGYYNVKQRENTGDVSVVSSKELERQPVSDPLAALQGRVPGLYINQVSGGLPGMSYSVQLMGRNSIFSNNNPLYIVDGVPFGSNTLTLQSDISPGGSTLSPFNNLNMSDIENIEVLKDADATAIYGSRGSNGVILITTKKGKAGRTKVDINISGGASSEATKLQLLNTQQYLQMRRQAFANDGLLVPSVQTTPSNNAYDINGTWDASRNTDWQKVLFANPARSTNVQASISGGNANTQFLISTSYNDQGTYLPGNFGDKKEGLHLNLTHNSDNQKFQMATSISYTNDNNFLPDANLQDLLLLPPDAPPLYDSNGNLNWANGTWTNPLASLQKTDRSVTDNIIGNINLSYELLKGLKLSVNAGGNYLSSIQTQRTPITVFDPSFATSDFRKAFYGTVNNKTWIVEPQISYDHEFGKGKFSALFGSTFQQNLGTTTGISGSGFTSDDLLGNIANAANQNQFNYNYTQYRYTAIYARAGYNYDGKYLLNLTARRDGSSRFGPGNQFGNFGAVGAAWIFSNEGFVKDNLKFLSFGKLRASYGVTGNDQIGDYQYLSVYGPVPSYGNTSSLIPVTLPNANFSWEVDKKLNLGLDLGFLQDRIQVTAAYFRNRTGNQLIGYALPTITGFSSIQANLPAEVQNKGFEFTLNAVNVKSKDFKWTSSVNLTTLRNKLLAYPGLAGSSYANTYVVGQSLFVQKLYHYTGINPITGTYAFQDVNGDGRISFPQDLTANKTKTQDYYGGFQNNFSYKGFQLDIFFQFVKQTGNNYLVNFARPGQFNLNNNQPTFILNNADLQTFTTSNTNALARANSLLKSSDDEIQDASFIRLKNVVFSYQLPLNWVKQAHLQNAKIFIAGQNLLTITKYQGIDPENQGYIPPMRTIQAGINLGL